MRNEIALLCGRLLLHSHQRLHRENRNVRTFGKTWRILHCVELGAELRQAKQTEDRLRDDRNQWRQTAEYLQKNSQQGQEDEEQEEGEEEEEVSSPSESPTNLGPGGGGGKGDDDNDSPSRRRGHYGSDPSGPPPGDPDGYGEHEVTEVKISRRDANKIIVPPFPKVTHLGSWMSGCIANVLSACADPNHEDWIWLVATSFPPRP